MPKPFTFEVFIDDGAEWDLLGGLMAAAANEHFDVLEEAFMLIPSEAVFTLPDRAKVYRVLRESYQGGTPLTFTLANARLNQLGKPETYLSWSELLAEVSTNRQEAYAAPYYAKIVVRLHQLRELYRAGEGLVADTQRIDAEPAEIVSRRVKALEGIVVPEVAGARVSDQLRSSWKRVAGGCPFIPTGLTHFDQKFGGLAIGEVMILAATPSVGKTALALQVCVNASMAKVPSLIVSIEMAQEAILARVAAQLQHKTVAWQRTQAGDQLELIWGKAAEQVGDDLYQINGVSDLDTIIAECRQRIRRDGIKLVVVDYLQLISKRGCKESRNLEVAAISGAFKSLAVNEGVAVMLLSQLNRDVHKSDDGPGLHHLRDSGAIEQDADVVAFLVRRGREYSDGVREVRLLVQKNRQGATGDIILVFHPQEMLFKSFVEPISDEHGEEAFGGHVGSDV